MGEELSIEERERILKRRRNIYITDEPKTVKDILEYLYILPNDTNIVSSSKRPTFSNRKCTTIQCKSYKNRSFDDYFRICKTYFPNITILDAFIELIEFIKILKNRLSNPNISMMTNGYCNDIKKPIITFFARPTIVDISPYHFNLNDLKGCGLFSWRELYDLIGVKNQNDNKELWKTINN